MVESIAINCRLSVFAMHDDWRSNGGCASARLATMDDAVKMKSISWFTGDDHTVDSLSRVSRWRVSTGG